ncbi:GNAT family N-acetyltransferase [Cloacibacillus porcorum]|uniref:GNAT family N-acetyltransferase n=1 Tax=Cloacibacillus porcorum TaxID=1197717 RepID=UPI001459AEC7|nr:GNAT family N-acetyltransferase [Cloacibacillus porcorum]MCC8183234.1 GNAT family N-acetyltransferase [Cloacibacillus porcorum]MDY5390160.1 GNAT family N-acetyltransferase [Cloacibacillus porcorum]NMF17780.1 GNAT family N-acetyltransferase [Cloacibacillus porcorum]
MKIELIKEEDKRNYLELLLLADEQEDMIDKYLWRGELFALYDGGLRAVCVVTDEGGGVFEIKNLAVEPRFQRRGYGRQMMEFVCSRYGGRCRKILVGTGESPLTIPFYRSCGFRESHRVKDFFIDNYDHPMFENGVRLKDMIYLERNFLTAED